MKGALYPLLWVAGLGLGIFGTSFLYQAVTTGQSGDLLVGLVLFLPGLYLSGQVLAHARKARRHPSHAPMRPVRGRPS